MHKHVTLQKKNVAISDLPTQVTPQNRNRVSGFWVQVLTPLFRS